MIEELRRAQENDPKADLGDKLSTLFKLGSCYREIGRIEEEKKCNEEFMRLAGHTEKVDDFQRFVVLIGLGKMALKEGDQQKALDYYRSIAA